MSKRKKPERPPDWALELARNELRFEVGCENTECCGPDDCGYCSRFVDVIAPALAAAYARGKEEAVKVVDGWHLDKGVRVVLIAAIRSGGA